MYYSSLPKFKHILGEGFHILSLDPTIHNLLKKKKIPLSISQICQILTNNHLHRRPLTTLK
jgi:hypothetical protein